MAYETFALCPTRYLAYLRSQCEAQGIPCRTGITPALSLLLGEDKDKDDIFAMAGFEDVVGIVNCTGVAAAKLTGDPTRARGLGGACDPVAGHRRDHAGRLQDPRQVEHGA